MLYLNGKQKPKNSLSKTCEWGGHRAGYSGHHEELGHVLWEGRATKAALYEHILCNLLFTLKYIVEGSATFVRFVFNRIVSLKFVQLLMLEIRSPTCMVTYYMEELCLQVKVGQIERACLLEIVKAYEKVELLPRILSSKEDDQRQQMSEEPQMEGEEGLRWRPQGSLICINSYELVWFVIR